MRACLDVADMAPNLTLLERTVNGQPGLVAQLDGVTVTVFAFALAGHRIKHVWAGDQRRELSGGGVAYLPKGVPHTYFVTSQTATILEIIAPGGLEQAFREAGWDLRTLPPEGWACTPDAVATAVAKVGCTILGPPPGSPGDNPIPTQRQQ
jgi:hypothetical protein